MINYTQILREHNFKATPQRVAITEILHKKGHINIDSLYEVMIEKFDFISLATIYKNINLMLEKSFIQEIKIPNTKSVYELTKASHSHLACKNCGSIEDINVALDGVMSDAIAQSNYKIDSINLVFSGSCKNCQ